MEFKAVDTINNGAQCKNKQFTLREAFGGHVGKQGWRSDDSTRFSPMSPGFDSRTRHCMWVESVVGSHLAPSGFSPGAPVFFSPPQHV